MSLTTSNNDSEEYVQKELYLECLGHLMGLEFEPRSGLKMKVTAKQLESSLDENMKSQTQSASNFVQDSKLVVNNVSIEKAMTWKPGAITATLKRLGVPISEEKKEPNLSDTLSELSILEPFIFRTSVSENSNKCHQDRLMENGIKISTTNTDTEPYDSKSTRPLKRGISPEETLSDQFKLNGRFIPPTMVSFKKPKLETETEPTKNGHQNIPDDSKPSYMSIKPSITTLFTSVKSTKQQNDCVQNLAVNTPNEESMEENSAPKNQPVFQTAYEKLLTEDKKKGINRNLLAPNNVRGPGLSKTFSKQQTNATDVSHLLRKTLVDEPPVSDNPELEELLAHEKLKVFEPKIVEAILSEVMEQQQITDWEDIAGLEGPKKIIKEVIIWPILRPDIFIGLRTSARGILLFGPPGTGKTMIGRLIATKSKSTFFNISASSLTSKWIGDGEKMVRCLFEVARIKQPSVIFIDEIDSILTQRSDTEHESSRRLKTEFLIQFDGCGTKSEDRVLVIGVTNRPQELDEAARRRLVKRIYIPLPDLDGRRQIVKNLMQDQNANLNTEDIDKIAEITEGYSGADMKSLCQDAAYGPIRDIGHMLINIEAENVRPIEIQDFILAQKRVKSSIADKDLTVYEKWNESFGC